MKDETKPKNWNEVKSNDSWAIFKIMGEFVGGYEKMSRIQSRGGCSCAGTYGHYLLDLNEEASDGIMDQVIAGEKQLRPGWIRISIHPTMTDNEIKFLCDSIIDLAENFEEWKKEYIINGGKLLHKTEADIPTSTFSESWFQY